MFNVMERRPVKPDELNKREQAVVLLSMMTADHEVGALQSLSDAGIVQILQVIKDITGITRPQQDVLRSFVQQDGLDQCFKTARQNGLTSSDPLSFLRDKEAETIGELIEPESPRSKAKIIGWFHDEQREAILNQVHPNLRENIRQRIESHPPTRNQQVSSVAKRLRDRYREQLSPEITVGAEKLLRSFRALDPDRRFEIAMHPEYPGEVGLFDFEDLAGFERPALVRLLNHVDDKTLAIAMKDVDREKRRPFLRAVSSRREKTIKNEQHYQGQPGDERIAEAQQSIINEARRLEQDGKLRR